MDIRGALPWALFFGGSLVGGISLDWALTSINPSFSPVFALFFGGAAGGLAGYICGRLLVSPADVVMAELVEGIIANQPPPYLEGSGLPGGTTNGRDASLEVYTDGEWLGRDWSASRKTKKARK